MRVLSSILGYNPNLQEGQWTPELFCMALQFSFILGLDNLKELQISNGNITDFGVSYLRGIYLLPFACAM